MPNYCNNVVEIRGPRRVVKALVDHRLDFQKIHPMPKDLDITAGREGPDDSPEQKALVAKEKANLKKYGHKNWYDWCVAEWGTKWNAGGDNDAMMVDYDEDQADTAIALFQFDTAWAPALGVLERLKSDHPELWISCRYSEPGMGFYGRWEDGQDECYQSEQHNSKHPFWSTDLGHQLNDEFGIQDTLAEYESEQQTEAEQKVRGLIVDKKPQNIIG